jgi:hypothetical protein
MRDRENKKQSRKKFFERFKAYANTDKAKEWFTENSHLIFQLFEDIKIRDFVFEPFKDVFKEKHHSDSDRILSVITKVALVNAVLGGLPGRMGVGVFIAMGLEAWMALKIARSIGIKVKSTEDIWTYFGLLAGISGVILFLFRHLIGFAWSLFSIIPFLPHMVFAELVVTNLVGIIFWVGFEEAYESGSFRIPIRMVGAMKNRMSDLYYYQKDMVKALSNKENLRLVGKRLKSWLSGEIVVDKAVMRGEVFPFLAMAYLIKGQYESLEGPLGKEFIQTIRRAYPEKLGNASLDEMRDFFSEHNPAQLKGDVSLVKGDLREHWGKRVKDGYLKELHEDRSHPGSDVILTDKVTGEEILANYKSTTNPDLIESHLEKYPNIVAIPPNELKDVFGDHPMVMFDGISDKEVLKVTEENFDKLLNQLEPIEAGEIVAAGVSAKAIGMLWPFVMAFIGKRISESQLKKALVKVLGESGVSLIARLSWAVALGPVFAWYLLARSVMLLTKGAEGIASQKRVYVSLD